MIININDQNDCSNGVRVETYDGDRHMNVFLAITGNVNEKVKDKHIRVSKTMYITVSIRELYAMSKALMTNLEIK